MAWKSSTWGKIWQNVCLTKQIATFIHFKVSILIFKPLNVIWNLCTSTYRITFVYMVMMSLSLWNCETSGVKEEIWSGILRIFTEATSKLQVSYPGDKSFWKLQIYLRTHGPLQNTSLICLSLHPHKCESSCFSSNPVRKRNCYYCHGDE